MRQIKLRGSYLRCLQMIRGCGAWNHQPLACENWLSISVLPNNTTIYACKQPGTRFHTYTTHHSIEAFYPVKRFNNTGLTLQPIKFFPCPFTVQWDRGRTKLGFQFSQGQVDSHVWCSRMCSRVYGLATIEMSTSTACTDDIDSLVLDVSRSDLRSLQASLFSSDSGVAMFAAVCNDVPASYAPVTRVAYLVLVSNIVHLPYLML